VLIREPAKWVARLRATAAAGPGTTPGRLLFRAELGTEAHMGPTGRYDKLRYQAEVLAFIITAANLPATPTGLSG
jgi:oligopeptidase B